MKSKTLISLLLTVAVMLSFSGCTKGVNLSDRAIVKMLFIDKLNNSYIAGAVVYECEPSADAGQAVDAAKIYFGAGKTISSALSAATQKQNKKPFYAQNEILVLGQGAINDIDNIYAYFAREESSRPNMAIFVSDLTTRDLMEEQQLVAVVESIEGIIKNTDRTFMYSKMVYQCDFSQQGFRGWLPQIEIKENSNAKVTGMLVFNNSEVVCTLEKQQSDIILLLQDRVDSFNIRQSVDEQNFECDIANIKKRVNVIKNQGEEQTVQIVISGAVRNLAFENNLNAVTQIEKDQVKQVVTKLLSENAAAAINEISSLTDSDIFGIAWWYTLYSDTQQVKNPNQIKTQVIFNISFL